eukprot:7378014-Prymnesium_polylepis.4
MKQPRLARSSTMPKLLGTPLADSKGGDVVEEDLQLRSHLHPGAQGVAIWIELDVAHGSDRCQHETKPDLQLRVRRDEGNHRREEQFPQQIDRFKPPETVAIADQQHCHLAPVACGAVILPSREPRTERNTDIVNDDAHHSKYRPRQPLVIEANNNGVCAREGNHLRDTLGRLSFKNSIRDSIFEVQSLFCLTVPQICRVAEPYAIECGESLAAKGGIEQQQQPEVQRPQRGHELLPLQRSWLRALHRCVSNRGEAEDEHRADDWRDQDEQQSREEVKPLGCEAIERQQLKLDGYIEELDKVAEHGGPSDVLKAREDLDHLCISDDNLEDRGCLPCHACSGLKFSQLLERTTAQEALPQSGGLHTTLPRLSGRRHRSHGRHSVKDRE